MKKNELLKAVANKFEKMTQKEVEAILTAYSEVVLETLKADTEEKIPMIGIGNFTVKHVPAKSGVTKLGGEEKAWSKDAHDEIAFKISSSVKTIA